MPDTRPAEKQDIENLSKDIKDLNKTLSDRNAVIFKRLGELDVSRARQEENIETMDKRMNGLLTTVRMIVVGMVLALFKFGVEFVSKVGGS